jgi:predicted dehydrogenase
LIRDMTRLKGVAAGAGYFSRYQYEAWKRLPEVEISAVYNRTVAKAEEIGRAFSIPRSYPDFEEMLDRERPDFVDIITPPETHLPMVRAAARRRIAVICQKPLAPTAEESRAVVEAAREAGIRFMVHENFRWQPWYREAKRLVEAGALGEVFSAYFRLRTGDGWPEDAYLARQPFFRDYPRLLVYETGVHFIDTFRYLLGEVETVYARLARRNPAIKGEDAGFLVLGMRGGATAVWDANRYNESEARNPRYTFGEMRLDGSKGHLLLDTGGGLTLKPLGQESRKHAYAHEDRGFAGDCVYAIQRHFVDAMLSGGPFESTGEDYLVNVRLVEACYESAATGRVVTAGA